ncbi:MAG: hypothetical protein LUC90_09080, partial [Lachnospiraceae bacterium]|nr:hypothetical protein [Lachnospiraceae bacterium]
VGANVKDFSGHFQKCLTSYIGADGGNQRPCRCHERRKQIVEMKRAEQGEFKKGCEMGQQ